VASIVTNMLLDKKAKAVSPTDFRLEFAPREPPKPGDIKRKLVAYFNAIKGKAE